MKKKSIISLIILAVAAISLIGCGNKDKKEQNEKDSSKVVISEEVNAALDDLYSMQINYSNGTAPLVIIPTVTVEQVYDNWDDIMEAELDNAPILLREYVEPSIVYFDYESGYSIKWNKDENDVVVEATDIEARDDYMQKAHK